MATHLRKNAKTIGVNMPEKMADELTRLVVAIGVNAQQAT